MILKIKNIYIVKQKNLRRSSGGFLSHLRKKYLILNDSILLHFPEVVHSAERNPVL